MFVEITETKRTSTKNASEHVGLLFLMVDGRTDHERIEVEPRAGRGADLARSGCMRYGVLRGRSSECIRALQPVTSLRTQVLNCLCKRKDEHDRAPPNGCTSSVDGNPSHELNQVPLKRGRSEAKGGLDILRKTSHTRNPRTLRDTGKGYYWVEVVEKRGRL